MNEKVSVAGVVISDGNGCYLIVQEKQTKVHGLWNLPAGRQDGNETLQQTAIREAKEEVGLDVELIEDKPLLSLASDMGDRQLHAFLAKIIGGELRPQKEELIDAKWLSLKEVEKLAEESKLRNKWTLESVRKAEEYAHHRN